MPNISAEALALIGPVRAWRKERFWTKVNKDGPLFKGTNCWLWTASKYDNGYGKYWFHGRMVRAHRVAYQLLIGNIPEGFTIDHLCRNRSCVNALTHMEVVTPGVNTLRGNGVSGINARKSYCPKGHPYDLLNTEWRKGNRHCRLCEKQRIRKKKSRAAYSRAYRARRKAEGRPVLDYHKRSDLRLTSKS